MSEQSITCSITEQHIKVQIKEECFKIKIAGGIGTGIVDHNLLNNLDYDNAGHTNFQKKINYISEYKAYEIPN